MLAAWVRTANGSRDATAQQIKRVRPNPSRLLDVAAGRFVATATVGSLGVGVANVLFPGVVARLEREAVSELEALPRGSRLLTASSERARGNASRYDYTPVDARRESGFALGRMFGARLRRL